MTLAVGADRYLYDTSTNALVTIPPMACEVLEDWIRLGARRTLRRMAGRHPAGELRKALEFLGACRQRGMLRPMGRLDFLDVVRTSRLRRLYACAPRRVTLGVTERCNQRCRYCPFVAVQGGPRRPVDMTWEIARPSVDRLLVGAPPGSAPTLELFGGEPTLKWPLVEQVIDHVRRRWRRRDVQLVLYTNATLLDRARLARLVASDVLLVLSLDGPGRVHDRERRLAGGAPTHSRVLRTLRALRRRHPAYLRRRVQVHCTFGLESDLLAVFRYFSRPAFRDLDITFGYRAGGGPENEADLARHEAQLEILDRWHVEALHGRRAFHRGLYASILGASLGGVLFRRVGTAGTVAHPNRACLPGQRRYFVSGTGSIHPCEHHVGPGSEIGDLKGGIDVARAGELLRGHAQLCNRMCQGCWAWRLCSHCFLHSLDVAGRPSAACKEKACRIERERIRRSLRRWIRIWAAEPRWARRVKGSLRWLEAHPDDAVP
ncbi:MAG TPA: radical SAM protein [Anaeromyxobacter sp.]|nr:radical SAM protein [Anaeromyxobacter sp.]